MLYIDDYNALMNSDNLFRVVRGLYKSVNKDDILSRILGDEGRSFQMGFYNDMTLTFAQNLEKAGVIKNHRKIINCLRNIPKHYYTEICDLKDPVEDIVFLLELDYTALSFDLWDEYVLPYIITLMIQGQPEYLNRIYYELEYRGMVEYHEGASPYIKEEWGKTGLKWKEAYKDNFELSLYSKEMKKIAETWKFQDY